MIKLNKIHNTDCLLEMSNIPDKSIDLVVTDPPYLHVKGGMKSKKFNTGTWKSESFMNTSMSDFDEKNIVFFLDLIKIKMKKMNAYVFCSKLQLQYYFKFIYENKYKYDLLIWDKQKTSMKSTKFFANDIEYIVRIYESGVSLNKIMVSDGSKADSTYYLKSQKYNQPKGKHETEKPLELIEKFVKLSSNESDVVLDPFMGSGTTAIACINTNRNFIGFELDKDCFEIANQRLKELGK
jgi:site-specific DNA-methyltransferase (adenine-specific)